MARHHLVLIPGFAGFDLLEPVDYFEGVASPLLGHPPPGAPRPVLHRFESLATAGVETRSRSLGLFLAELIDHGSLQEGDRLHLIAHSTGGLDLRHLLLDLSDRPDLPVDERRSSLLSGDLLERISSVQYLSTPQRGTVLARYLADLQPLPQAVTTGIFFVLHGLGPFLGGAAKGRSGAGLVEALRRTAESGATSGVSYERTQARGAFYKLLRWLNEMTSDFRVVEELCPRAEPGGPSDEELALYETIRVRSIVTRAAPREEELWNLYTMLDEVMRYDPPESLGEPRTVALLEDPARSRRVDEEDHDGIVHSLSMIWPDPEHSALVEADHADLIGHFRRRGAGGLDLLPSSAPFDEERFDAFWREVARFALSPEPRSAGPE